MLLQNHEKVHIFVKKKIYLLENVLFEAQPITRPLPKGALFPHLTDPVVRWDAATYLQLSLFFLTKFS